jgi:hypothetical protein
LDKRSNNTVGCNGYKNILTEDIVALYLSGKTLVEVANQFKISYWTVLDRLKKVGVKKNTLRPIGNNAVFEGFTEQSCYWAGFIAADGFIARGNVCIELNSIDDEHLKKLCRFSGRDEFLWKRSRLRKERLVEYSSISLNSQKIADDLNHNFNIVPAKSKILEPPSEIPQHLISHYIRGYIDGDGSIGWHKGNKSLRLSLCSGSKQLLDWVAENIKLGSKSEGNPSVVKRNNADTYVIEYNGKYCIGILDWLYEDSTPETRLCRKHERYTQYKKHLEEYNKSKALPQQQRSKTARPND